MQKNGIIAHLAEKGYGFIQVPGYSSNVFFHAKELKGIAFPDLNKGDEVMIDEIVQGEKGMSARGVSLIK